MNLQLPILTLRDLGFKRTIIPIIDVYDNSSYILQYELTGINSRFYFVPDERTNNWYYETRIGEAINSISLKITTLDDLKKLLDIFSISYNKFT